MLGVVWGSWPADLSNTPRRPFPGHGTAPGLFSLFARCRHTVPFFVPALGVRRLGQENQHSWRGFRCQQQRRLGTACGATTTATTTVGRRSGYPCRLPRSAVLARTSQAAAKETSPGGRARPLGSLPLLAAGPVGRRPSASSCGPASSSKQTCATTSSSPVLSPSV